MSHTSGLYASCTSASISPYTHGRRIVDRTSPPLRFSLYNALHPRCFYDIPDHHTHTCLYCYACDTIYGIDIILNLVNLGYLAYLASPFAYVFHITLVYLLDYGISAGSLIFAWIHWS